MYVCMYECMYIYVCTHVYISTLIKLIQSRYVYMYVWLRTGIELQCVYQLLYVWAIPFSDVARFGEVSLEMSLLRYIYIL